MRRLDEINMDGSWKRSQWIFCSRIKLMQLRRWRIIQTFRLFNCRIGYEWMVTMESRFQALRVQDWQDFMIGYSAPKGNYAYPSMDLKELYTAIKSNLPQIRSIVACIPLNLFAKAEGLREFQKSLYTRFKIGKAID